MQYVPESVRLLDVDTDDPLEFQHDHFAHSEAHETATRAWIDQFNSSAPISAPSLPQGVELLHCLEQSSPLPIIGHSITAALKDTLKTLST